ncbi:hypothetical protein J7337_013919 [Fusarium musae]|uniref:Uncharacterized protein n=1 Tax=Fusarium musae TaxID=1042133 RepID=A0A9P8IGH2_9HYPO|nr:hypothetical protein J7337_013919 [Fusarium musae]KAG9494780.1 hypothetical protein J7337_013919 [Fusarium musae]
MGVPTETSRLRARQFQRFYHHKPPMNNRDLITDAILRKAEHYEPIYELSQCEAGEEEFPPWATNRASLRSTVTAAFWREAFDALDDAQALIDHRNRTTPKRAVQNTPTVIPDETEQTTATGAPPKSKTMKYLRSAVDTPGPDSMPGSWDEGEEFPFSEKQVARYLRWTKKQGEGHGKEQGEKC